MTVSELIAPDRLDIGNDQYTVTGTLPRSFVACQALIIDDAATT